MRDLQNERDQRNIPLDRVGVSDLSYPIEVRDRDHQVQRTVARIAMAVSLPRDYRGTHMSRFVEALTGFDGELDLVSFRTLLEDVRARLEAENAALRAELADLRERLQSYRVMEDVLSATGRLPR